MKPKVIVISGEKGEGKTTFAQNLVSRLIELNYKVAGILAQGYWKDNLRDRFDLVNLMTNKRISFCQRTPEEGWERIRHFCINPQGQQFGEDALDTRKLQNYQVVIIDELGPFELQGKGWAVAVKKLLQQQNKTIIFIVRSSLVEEIAAHFEISEYALFLVGKHSISDVVASLS